MRRHIAFSEVILLDFLPKPGELQGLIAARLPVVLGDQTPDRKHPAAARRPTPKGPILLDFLPQLAGRAKGR